MHIVFWCSFPRYFPTTCGPLLSCRPFVPHQRSCGSKIHPTSHSACGSLGSEPQLPFAEQWLWLPSFPRRRPSPPNLRHSPNHPLIPPHPGLLLPGDPSRRPETRPRSRTSRGSWHLARESPVSAGSRAQDPLFSPHPGSAQISVSSAARCRVPDRD
jgi:hypothetical protein